MGDAVDVVTAAVGISRATFADGGATFAVIGRDDVYADSLAGSALGGGDEDISGRTISPAGGTGSGTEGG